MSKKRFFAPPEPYVQVRKDAMIFYTISQQSHNRSTVGFSKGSYQGFTTGGAKKRIRRTVDILCQLSPPRTAKNPVTGKSFKHSLSFITLTISGKERHMQPIEANTTLLAPFIRKMRNKHNMITYIWKAEFQSNGQLHYHITTPSVIHYQYVKDTWNNLLSQQGLLSAYMAEHPGQFPNSTDIHSVYKQKDIVWYLSKEISKNVQDKKVKGKVWDCSLNLRGTKFYSIPEGNIFKDLLTTENFQYLESCSIYKKSDAWKLLDSTNGNAYNEWRASIIGSGLW